MWNILFLKTGNETSFETCAKLIITGHFLLCNTRVGWRGVTNALCSNKSQMYTSKKMGSMHSIKMFWIILKFCIKIFLSNVSSGGSFNYEHAKSLNK